MTPAMMQQYSSQQQWNGAGGGGGGPRPGMQHSPPYGGGAPARTNGMYRDLNGQAGGYMPTVASRMMQQGGPRPAGYGQQFGGQMQNYPVS